MGSGKKVKLKKGRVFPRNDVLVLIGTRSKRYSNLRTQLCIVFD